MIAEVESEKIIRLLERLVENTKGIEKRFPLDQVVMISATTPWILDYKERRNTYVYSANALILSLEDMGTFYLPSNAWVNVNFIIGMRVVAIGQTANVPLFVRCSDDELIDARYLQSSPVGYVSAYASNAAALTSSTDYPFKWGASGTNQVNHLMIQNNTTINLNFDLDVVATAGSPVLLPGQTVFFDVQVLILHLFQAGTPNVNGSSAANIVVRGWL